MYFVDSIVDSDFKSLKADWNLSVIKEGVGIYVQSIYDEGKKNHFLQRFLSSFHNPDE